MAPAASAAQPSARMRAPATEGGSVTIREIWSQPVGVQTGGASLPTWAVIRV
jgi:hypothetical protein